MKGRKPLPSVVCQMRGNPSHSRRKNVNEPQFGVIRQLPVAPKWLDKQGKAAWCETGAELVNMGLLTLANIKCFEGYCAAYARAVRCEQANEAATALKAWATVRQFAAEFGLTPSAASRISVPQKSEGQNKLEQFLKVTG